MSVSAVVIISIMLKLIPRAQKEQLPTAVCRSNHKVFPLAEAAEHKDNHSEKKETQNSVKKIITHNLQVQSSMKIIFTITNLS